MKARLFAVVVLTAVLFSFPALSSNNSANHSTVYAGHQQAGGKYCPGECVPGLACPVCNEDCTIGLAHRERKQKHAPEGTGVDPGAGALLFGLGLLLWLRLKMMV